MLICEYGTPEPRKLLLRREDKGECIDFEFPFQIFKLKLFKSAN